MIHGLIDDDDGQPESPYVADENINPDAIARANIAEILAVKILKRRAICMKTYINGTNEYSDGFTVYLDFIDLDNKFDPCNSIVDAFAVVTAIHAMSLEKRPNLPDGSSGDLYRGGFELHAPDGKYGCEWICQFKSWFKTSLGVRPCVAICNAALNYIKENKL